LCFYLCIRLLSSHIIFALVWFCVILFSFFFFIASLTINQFSSCITLFLHSCIFLFFISLVVFLRYFIFALFSFLHSFPRSFLHYLFYSCHFCLSFVLHYFIFASFYFSVLWFSYYFSFSDYSFGHTLHFAHSQPFSQPERGTFRPPRRTHPRQLMLVLQPRLPGLRSEGGGAKIHPKPHFNTLK